MDSMRSLNTSLPSSTPRPQPPEQLLQQFKAAALSVTNLYKNARICSTSLTVRTSVSETERGGRFDNGQPKNVTGLDRKAAMKMLRPTSVTEVPLRLLPAKRNLHPKTIARQTPTSAPAPTSKPESITPPPPPAQLHETPSFATPAVFTFSAGPTYPQCQELDMDVQSSDNSSGTMQDGAPVSVSVMPRNSRPHHRHNNHPRSNARLSPRESPASLGSKRKFTFPDFFDLSGLNNGRDASGGGKRGRFT
ncbi:hypothetical protein N7453_004509 [Penicillium expansum]|nr:hypothetical protein N7453_004509 [Penicillium expansum]